MEPTNPLQAPPTVTPDPPAQPSFPANGQSVTGSTPPPTASPEGFSPAPNMQPAAPQPTTPFTPAAPPAPEPHEISVTQTASVASTPVTESVTGSSTLDPHPAPTNIFTEICTHIIREQERIIGVIALEQATHVPGLKVDPITYHCEIVGEGSKVIDALIDQYRDFFGHAAVEVCKEAAAKFMSQIPQGEVPTSLQ